jgi:hypothetical protein
MTESSATRWQFSLRTLLVATTVCALIAGAFKAFDEDIFYWVLLITLSAAPIAMIRSASWPAFIGAWFAVYGPFLVMAAYTYFYVACSHCKEATVAVLPYGPGLLPFELARSWLDLPRLNELTWLSEHAYLLPLMFSMTVVFGLAWVLRTRGRWLRALSIVVALSLFAFCAYGTLMLIQA